MVKLFRIPFLSFAGITATFCYPAFAMKLVPVGGCPVEVASNIMVPLITPTPAIQVQAFPSNKGLQMKLEPTNLEGSRVTLLLPSADGSEPISLRGRVVRTQNDGEALAITLLGDDGQWHHVRYQFSKSRNQPLNSPGNAGLRFGDSTWVLDYQGTTVPGLGPAQIGNMRPRQPLKQDAYTPSEGRPPFHGNS